MKRGSGGLYAFYYERLVVLDYLAIRDLNLTLYQGLPYYRMTVGVDEADIESNG